MFNKVYDAFKKVISKNFVFILIFVILILLFNITLPYKISMPGGYINVSKKIKYDDAYEASGSFNMAYVSEYDASIPLYLLSFVIPNWDLEKNSDYLLENDSVEDYLFRGRLALKEANNNAKVVAFKNAGFDYSIDDYKFYVAYIDGDSETDLKVGDEIISIDGVSISSKKDISDFISSKSVGDDVSFSVINKDKNYLRKATIKEVDGKKQVGIVVYEEYELVTNPDIKIINDNSESGPSGGLMTSLAIYNSLVEEDITHGKKIVGTGTIDRDGNVGSIGGVKYKILGAAKKGAKIFLIPVGENYDEAKKIVDENNLKLKLVPISTFDEALDFLNSL